MAFWLELKYLNRFWSFAVLYLKYALTDEDLIEILPPVSERVFVYVGEVLLLNPCELGCQETIGEPPKV